MKERLDCALISVPGTEALISSLLSHERLPTSRLHFSVIQPTAQAGLPPANSDIPASSANNPLSAFPSATFLQELTYSLRHYDVICLPVFPGSLVWTRIVLQQSRIEDHRPIFVLGQSLRPIGLIDLLKLGVVDFALWPCDPEEVRVRMLHALNHLRGQHYRSPALLGDSIKSQPYGSDRFMPERFGPDRLRPHEGNPAQPGAHPSGAYPCASTLQPAAGMLRDAAFSARPYDSLLQLSRPHLSRPQATGAGAASAWHPSVSPADSALVSGSSLRRITGVSPVPLSSSAMPEVPRICCQEIARYADGFQQLKAIVVAQFERAYLTQALARSKGNIALAARNSLKHRRAFWALMRKHQISADAFREYDY